MYYLLRHHLKPRPSQLHLIHLIYLLLLRHHQEVQVHHRHIVAVRAVREVQVVQAVQARVQVQVRVVLAVQEVRVARVVQVQEARGVKEVQVRKLPRQYDPGSKTTKPSKTQIVVKKNWWCFGDTIIFMEQPILLATQINTLRMYRTGTNRGHTPWQNSLLRDNGRQMLKKTASKTQMTLSEAAQFVKEKHIARRAWKGKHVVKAFSMFHRNGLIKVSYGSHSQTFMPLITDCIATDWGKSWHAGQGLVIESNRC